MVRSAERKESIINFEALCQLTSAQAVEAARSAMDAVSVSGFKFDRRGRLEAGVRPAPPSTEVPAYVRITRRGNNYLVDCRHHGRGAWCLHAMILALHHLGSEPIYRHSPKKEVEEIALGYQIEVRFNQSDMIIRIRDRSGSCYKSNPLSFLTKRFAELAITSDKAISLAELCEQDGGMLRISRRDATDAMEALHGAELITPAGVPYTRSTYRQPLPQVSVRVSDGLLFWQADPALPKDSLFLPGWPGFLVGQQEIARFPGYLPDFQHLTAAKSPIPLTSTHLLPLLQEKHGVHWLGKKPQLLAHFQEPGLQLQVEQGDLVGQLGIWHDHHFYALKSLDDPNQVLQFEDMHLLLQTSSYHMSRFRQEAERARLPLDSSGTRFRVRSQQAADFIEKSQIPKQWRTDRLAADHFFGRQRLDVEILWSSGACQPRYQLGEEMFEHQMLADHLLENRQGARLPDGRILNFDSGVVETQQQILTGLSSLHEDEDRRADLLARVCCRGQGEAGPELSDYWQGLLRPYQVKGVRWMTGNLGRSEPALLADDMGLGKTIQTLAMLDVLKTAAPQLVVVPTSLIENWREEAERFCAHRKVYLHHGPKRKREAPDLEKTDLVITSYGTLLRDLDMLYDVAFGVVVLDEAQTIKNATSRISKAVCELWCQHRVALTGTPIENRLTELWAIFRFLAPDYLGSEEDVKAITMPGTPGFAALKAKVTPFLLRRKKEEVAHELPSKQETTILLPMENEQAQIYGQYLDQSRQQLSESKKQGAISILTRLLRLRQVCCHPGLVDDMYQKTASNKLNYLLEQLDEITKAGHGALVFSQFTRLLGLVKFALEEADLSYLYLDGRSRNRQDLVRRFQAGEAPIFLISLKAGGVGLNLTRASYVYHLDPWWNPAVEAQATDRAHRIGQKKQVLSYKLISQGTVEERILRLQAGKKLISDGLWQEPDQLFKEMDRDTLLGLLN